MKKIFFLTGTRADFGKIKSLIEKLLGDDQFEVFVCATGMHLNRNYGYTIAEIEKCGYPNISSFENHKGNESMDNILANTIKGFSEVVKKEQPDLIVVHGDRVEALAGAIVGAMNNILVGHIEGGEVSGTIDELVRHAVSKMSHCHFVANKNARQRLLQMGEDENCVFEIGSPDIDVMLSEKLPNVEEVKEYYEIPFDDFGIVMFHPVTTELEEIEAQTKTLVDGLIQSDGNYIVIYPNNDTGNETILKGYEAFANNPKFKLYPSLRFEYFLVLLKNSQFIIGNSSAGVREAPYYNVKTINLGTRQNNRSDAKSIINCDYNLQDILGAMKAENVAEAKVYNQFGVGKSDDLFHTHLKSPKFWEISKQKFFIDFSRETL